MAERDQRAALLSTAWVLALAGLAFILLGDVAAPLQVVVVGVAALAFGWQIMVPTRSGNVLSLDVAVAVAAPMLLRGPEGTVDVAAVAVVYSLGYLIGWSVRVLHKADVDAALAVGLRHVFGAFIYVSAFMTVDGLRVTETVEITAVLPVAAGGVLWLAFEMMTWTLSTHRRRHVSRRYLVLLSFQDWVAAMVLIATGGLLGLVVPAVGWLVGVTVVAVPYAVAHFAFYRRHQTLLTYGQTIRALAKISEVAGLSPEGHSERAADLSVAVGQELGMTPHDVAVLEYAALMHDIGRITLNEPNIVKMGFTEDDIAQWGFEIITEAPYLAEVAEMVRVQHQPYRRPGEAEDPDLPLSSKVIKAASAYDHATHELGFSQLEAVEVLHRGAAYDYDPDVVRALRMVVSRA